MKAAALLLALSGPALAAGVDGGHERPKALIETAPPADERRATLEEMWQRGLLPPDQSAWSPTDFDLLQRIRRVEADAKTYLRRRFGSERPWTVRAPGAGAGAPRRLTREGYEKYETLLSQDAIVYFESKGADAKWTFKLKSMDGKPLFDSSGRLTEEGARVYRRAALNLEVFWKGGDGQVFGTRRPPAPTKNP